MLRAAQALESAFKSSAVPSCLSTWKWSKGEYRFQRGSSP